MSDYETDVLMAAYNCAPFIEETVRSILAQSYRSFRLIIADDGSTDETAAIVRRLAEGDDRILLMQKENGGIVSALEYGLGACTAPFIARHDADDLSDPERFAREIAYLKAHPDCVAVSAQLRDIDERGRDLGTYSPTDCAVRGDCWSVPAKEPYIMQPLMMVRSEALRAAGGYRKLAVAEDSDLCWRLNERGRLHTIPEIMGSYRTHAGSITRVSVVRGRQMAVWSQLAALSAQRRERGRPDLVFDEALFRRLAPLTSLDAMISVATDLCSDPQEELWMRYAICAKLLDVCYYKPYLPDMADIGCIRRTIRAAPALYHSDAGAFLRRAMKAIAMRLLVRGHVAEGLRLVEVWQWPGLLPRAAGYLLFSERRRVQIKQVLGLS